MRVGQPEGEKQIACFSSPSFLSHVDVCAVPGEGGRGEREGDQSRAAAGTEGARESEHGRGVLFGGRRHRQG